MKILRFALNRLGNLMFLARNDEITTLSSIARDDVVNYRKWATTKPMWRGCLIKYHGTRARQSSKYHIIKLNKLIDKRDERLMRRKA